MKYDIIIEVGKDVIGHKLTKHLPFTLDLLKRYYENGNELQRGDVLFIADEDKLELTKNGTYESLEKELGFFLEDCITYCRKSWSGTSYADWETNELERESNADLRLTLWFDED